MTVASVGYLYDIFAKAPWDYCTRVKALILMGEGGGDFRVCQINDKMIKFSPHKNFIM